MSLSSSPTTPPSAETGEPASGSVASSAVASTVGIAMQGLSRLAYTVLIGRAFGTESLGHASTLMSLSIFAALLWPTAAGNTASRFLAVALHDQVSDGRLIRVLGATMATSSLLLGGLGVVVARTFGNDWTTSLLAGWLVIGYGAYAYTRGAQLGYHRAPRVAAWDTVTALLALGLLIVVCATGQGAAVLAPLAIGYTVFAVACWPRGNRVTGAGASTRPAVGFASWNVLAGLTTNGLLQLAMISAQVVAPGEAAGVYAAAFTLATPASMLGQAVSQIIIPAFAHRTDAASLRQRGPLTLFVVFAATSALLFGLVAALAPWYLPLFYPAEGVAAAPLLRFLMVGVYIFTIGLIPAALLLASGRSRPVALASVAGFVAGLVSMVALGGTLGVNAGSAGFLIGSSVNLLAMVALSLRPARPQSSARATLQ